MGIKWFDSLFGQKHAQDTNAKPSDREKEIALKGGELKRLSLAKNTKTHREILFYLAEHDPSPRVRKAVAKNKSTPLHASAALAVDSNLDVRLTLAGRLVKLLPDLSVDTQSQLYAYAVQALGTLALDEVLKIRRALSSTLKDHAYAPPSVAAQLARDIEREVAEPILRFCTALSDQDMIDILADHPASWAAEAVARRKSISAKVSRAVIDTGHAGAGKFLLENDGAEITIEVLEVIIERAKEFPEWHEPLATRHTLPEDMAKRLSRYVDARIRKLLEEKGDYDLQTTEIVTDATRRRIHLQEVIGDEEQTPEQVRARVRTLYKAKKLGEQMVSDALGLRDRAFVLESLSCLSGLPRPLVDKAISLQAPKIICALCWKAGFSMRLAFRIQQEIAHVKVKDLLYPRDGVDYPLTPKDMEWHLEFLGDEGK
ncbi:MAG: DUF2336 domain-containing protein [Alphaproteobacteria bacterium]|nr:DUF2336 domain-containing protein [Alphaproteobacteria bacterium]